MIFICSVHYHLQYILLLTQSSLYVLILVNNFLTLSQNCFRLRSGLKTCKRRLVLNLGLDPLGASLECCIISMPIVLISSLAQSVERRDFGSEGLGSDSRRLCCWGFKMVMNLHTIFTWKDFWNFFFYIKLYLPQKIVTCNITHL